MNYNEKRWIEHSEQPQDTRWIQTYTGRKVWPLDPTSLHVVLEDIVWHLSLKCRFSGACEDFYSVLQHEVHVSELLETLKHPPLTSLYGLLHDSAEYVLPDIARPIKDAFYKGKYTFNANLEYTSFSTLEDEWMAAIYCALGIPTPDPFNEMFVKQADTQMLLVERDKIMRGSLVWEGLTGVDPPDFFIPDLWSPEEARIAWYKRYYRLFKEWHQQGASKT